MRVLWMTLCLGALLFSSSVLGKDQGSEHSQRLSRFELLGMLDEYGGRRLDDPDCIENFYGSEVAAAERFEKVLGEFCTAEGLPKDWHRETDSVGHISFTGERIAAAINTSYFEDKRYGFGLGPVGVLSSKLMRSASRAEMLRYVVGAYKRYGDAHGTFQDVKAAPRAFFSTANNHSKFCVLTDFLSRLGCTHLRFYLDSGGAPSFCLLAFRPSDRVKAATGIRREITREEVRSIDSGAKQTKLPRFSWRRSSD